MQPVHPCPPHWLYKDCVQVEVEVAVAALLVAVLDALDDVVVLELEALEVDVDNVVLVVLDTTDDEEEEPLPPPPPEESTPRELAVSPEGFDDTKRE